MVGVGVMIVSIVLTLGLVHYQRYVVRKTASVAISADSLHYAGDVLINGSVIVSILLATELGITQADPLFALAIAAFLLYNAWQILRESFNLLMDREFSVGERQRIRDLVLEDGEVRSLHDLRTRSSGPMAFIQLHLELDRDLPLWKAHDISTGWSSSCATPFPTPR